MQSMRHTVASMLGTGSLLAACTVAAAAYWKGSNVVDALQVWYMYSRWHALEGGGGPAAAAQVLAKACKVSICSHFKAKLAILAS